MASPGQIRLQLLITARDTASETIGRVRAAIGGIGDAVSAGLEPLKQWGALLGAAIGIGGANETIKLADAYTSLTNQIRAATQSEEEYQRALAAVTEIAQGLPADLDATAKLYSKVNANAKDLGLTQQQVGTVTEIVSKAMKLEGAEAGTTNGAITQLSQSLASGVVRGDEFNSVMEASPSLMAAVAKGLGVATGELRSLAEEGQLTAQRFVQALLTQQQAIFDTYDKRGKTVEQSMERLHNAVLLFVGGLDQQAGISSKASAALGFLADNLGLVANVLGAALATALTKSVVSMGEYVTASLAARAAAQQQAIASEQQRAAALTAAEANVIAAQAAYNRARAEQAAAAAQLAALESLAGLFASEEALTLARGQSAAAAQAVASATQRLTIAQAALSEMQAAGAVSAGLLSRAMGFLAGPAGLILTAVSAFGLLFAATSKQNPAMEALSQSTDEYANALRRMTTAQLAAAQIALSKEIEAQQRAVSNAADAASEYVTYTDLYTGASLTAKRGEEERTKALAALDTETQKLHDLENRRLMATQAQSEATIRAQQAENTHVGALLAQVTALDALQSKLEKRGQSLQAIADAEIAATEAALRQAQADDDANKIGELTLKLAQQRIEAAQQQAAIAAAEAEAARAKVADLQAVKDQTQALTKIDIEQLAQAKEDLRLKDARSAAAQALVQQLQSEATSTETLTAKQQKLVELAEKNTQAAQNYTSGLESVAQAQIEGIRQEIALANAKGYTWTAQQKSVELAKIEVQWGQTLAAVKQAEIAAERAEVEAKLAQKQAIEQKTDADQKEIAALQLKLQALGLQSQAVQVGQQVDAERQKQLELTGGAQQQNTQQTQQNTQALQDNSAAQEANADALREQAKAADEASAAEERLKDAAAQSVQQGRIVSDIYSGWTERLGQLSSAAVAAFQEMRGATVTAANDTTHQLENLEKQIDSTRTTLNAIPGDQNGLVGWARDTAAAAVQVEEAFLGQARAAEALTQTLDEAAQSGGANLDDLARQAAVAKDRFTLLDQTRLDGLQRAIDSARQKMDELRQSSEDALDSAQRSVFAALDNQIGELEYEFNKKRLDLQNQLNAARESGDQKTISNLQQALKLEQEAYEVNHKKLQEQEAAKNQTTSDGGNASTKTTTSSGGGGISSVKTYRLDLSANGKTLTAQTNTDPQAFLDALERDRTRSLA